MIMQVYLLLLSAWQLHEGYSTTANGKPWSLHGLFTLCDSLDESDGLVVLALFNLQGFSLFLKLCTRVYTLAHK